MKKLFGLLMCVIALVASVSMLYAKTEDEKYTLSTDNVSEDLYEGDWVSVGDSLQFYIPSDVIVSEEEGQIVYTGKDNMFAIVVANATEDYSSLDEIIEALTDEGITGFIRCKINGMDGVLAVQYSSGLEPMSASDDQVLSGYASVTTTSSSIEAYAAYVETETGDILAILIENYGMSNRDFSALANNILSSISVEEPENVDETEETAETEETDETDETVETEETAETTETDETDETDETAGTDETDETDETAGTDETAETAETNETAGAPVADGGASNATTGDTMTAVMIAILSVLAVASCLVAFGSKKVKR